VVGLACHHYLHLHHPEVRVARCLASRREPRRMDGPVRPQAGPSPFEGRYAATSSDNRFAVARG